MTPENSEQPRETRAGEPLTEEQLMLQDAVATGTGFMAEGKRVDPQGVRIATAKVSSPELASLAAKYVNLTDQEMWALFADDRTIRYEEGDDPVPAYADVRRLAASVLAQAEAKTNAGR